MTRPIVHFYIWKKLAVSLLAVSLAMTSLIIVFVFIGELDAQKNNYHLQEVLMYTLMLAPGVNFEILPFICLVSTLVVMGSMAENNEIVVLNTSGMSSTRLSVLVLSFIFCVVCLFIVVDNFFFSALNKYAIEFKEQHKYPSKQAGTFDFWVSQNNTIMNLRSVQSDGNINRSYIYEFDDNKNLERIQESSAGKIEKKLFSFTGVDSTNISSTSNVKGDVDIQIQLDTDYHFDFRRFEQIDPQYLTLTNLFGIASYQMKQKEGPNVYWATLLAKLLLPLNVCALAFLSLSFVFGSTRSFSAGSRIFIGIIVGLVFYFISRLTVPIHVALHIPAAITTLFPGALALLLGLGVKKFIQ